MLYHPIVNANAIYERECLILHLVFRVSSQTWHPGLQNVTSELFWLKPLSALDFDKQAVPVVLFEFG